jgi:DNA invertase Pin-like site-specific DNA recombinase
VTDKIRATHLERKAVVYLRQSSLKQVREHRESTARQYALRERAIALGWTSDAVEVIDEDLGQSGQSADWRTGFRRLAESIAQGRVGALFALEVSRFARSSADWYRLLELASLADVVIADEDVVYDPHDYNDRLLLGLKGQFADAERYWMRLRLNGGKLSKARRGEVVFNPPTGYVWGDDGRLCFDPDEKVQRAVRLVFERFRLESSARAVVRYFARHSLQMPVRVRGGEVRWVGPPGYRHALNILHSPLYAGAYVFGRREQRMALVSGEVRRRRTTTLPMDSWKVCLKDHHPAYVSWDEFMANQKKLRDHWTAGRRKQPDLRGAAREGKALLQGLVLCGRCGRRMHSRYFSPGGRHPSYQCQGSVDKLAVTGGCWMVSAKHIDEAVTRAFLDVIQPAEVELALAVARDAERQSDEIRRQWQLRLEHAGYEVRLAERRYKAVDPDNRTVARTLEREWNDKLEELARLDGEYEDVRRREKVELSDEDRRQALALARDLPRVWNAPTTTHAERKNLLRMLLRDVTLSPIDVPERITHVQILWVTGATSELRVPRPTNVDAARTPEASLEALRGLCEKGLTDAAVAAELNRRGLASRYGELWAKSGVSSLRRGLGLRRRHGAYAGRRPPLRREDGLYSVYGVAKLLGITRRRVYIWISQGDLAPTEGGNGTPVWFRLDTDEIKRLRELRASRIARGYTYRITERRQRRRVQGHVKGKVHCG